MIQKLIRSALALSMAVQLLAVPALAAEDAPVYLALGDSISTGYGLSAENQRFSSLVAANRGYKENNKAENGLTITDLADKMESGTYDAELAKADVITLTCGGNDMIKVMYHRVTELYNKGKAPEDQITAEDVPDIISGTSEKVSQLTMINTAIDAIVGDEDKNISPLATSEEFKSALEALDTALEQMMNHIRSINPEAAVIIPTQYNPYMSFYEKAIVKNAYVGIEACIPYLNTIITENAPLYGYVVTDVYGAFRAVFDADTDAKKENYKKDPLCNAYFRVPSDNDFDFHPNVKGHALIAETILNTLNTLNRNLDETEFSLVSSNLNKGTVTVTGTGVYSSIAVAFYNSEEKMVGFDVKSLNGSETQTTLSAKLSGTAVKGKVFLFQRGSLIPHSEAIPF